MNFAEISICHEIEKHIDNNKIYGSGENNSFGEVEIDVGNITYLADYSYTEYYNEDKGDYHTSPYSFVTRTDISINITGYDEKGNSFSINENNIINYFKN